MFNDLVNAACSGDVKLFQELVSQMEDPRQNLGDGTILHEACWL